MQSSRVQILFHPHKFKYIGVVGEKWYCDGLNINPSKKCFSGQKAVFQVQKCTQFKCEEGCNITLCDACIETQTDYKIPKIKTGHPHTLYYRVNTNLKWYCDSLPEKGSCQRNHKKEFIPRNHPFFQCLSGCDYMICDLCAAEYDEVKTYHPKKMDEVKRGPIKPSKTVDVSAIRHRIIPTDLKSIPLVNQSKLKDDEYLKENYESELRSLGEGSFGKVFLAKKKGEAKEIALKVVETDNMEDFNDTIKELMNLSRLKNHPNILDYKDFKINIKNKSKEESINQIYIEMPIAGPDLEKLISQLGGKIPEDYLIEILGEILTGLNYAHHQNCAHLDLKPSNILMMGSSLKIADWGGSLLLKKNTSTKHLYNLQVSPGYVAPEITEENYELGDRFNYYLCDIYSLGIILLRCCGVEMKQIIAIPKGINEVDAHEKKIEEFIDGYLKEYSKELKDLIRRMSAYDPKKRDEIEEIIKKFKENF